MAFYLHSRFLELRTYAKWWLVFCNATSDQKIIQTKEDRTLAMQRHLEFFNTHPYIASPIIGVTLALEEERANGAPVDDVAIQGLRLV